MVQVLRAGIFFTSAQENLRLSILTVDRRIDTRTLMFHLFIILSIALTTFADQPALGTYLCQNEIEVHISEQPLGTEKVVFMKVLNKKDFKSSADSDAEGIVIKRTMARQVGTKEVFDYSYDLANYSFRILEQGRITINNYKSSSAGSDCKLKQL